MSITYSTSIRSPFNVVSSTAPNLRINFENSAQTALQKITASSPTYSKLYAASRVKPASFTKLDLTKPVSIGDIKRVRSQAAGHKQDVGRAKGNLKKLQAEAKAQVVEAMKTAAGSMPEISQGAVTNLTAANSDLGDAGNLALNQADPTNGGLSFTQSIAQELMGQTLSSTQVERLLDKTCDVLKANAPETANGFDFSDVTPADLESLLSPNSPEMLALELEEGNIRAAELDCNLADSSNHVFLQSGTPEERMQILGSAAPEYNLHNEPSADFIYELEVDAPTYTASYKVEAPKYTVTSTYDLDNETVYLTGASLSGVGGQLSGLNANRVPEDLVQKLRRPTHTLQPRPAATMSYNMTPTA